MIIFESRLIVEPVKNHFRLIDKTVDQPAKTGAQLYQADCFTVLIQQQILPVRCFPVIADFPFTSAQMIDAVNTISARIFAAVTAGFIPPLPPRNIDILRSVWQSVNKCEMFVSLLDAFQPRNSLWRGSRQRKAGKSNTPSIFREYRSQPPSLFSARRFRSKSPSTSVCGYFPLTIRQTPLTAAIAR
jgi:hypothetical protein